MATSLFLIDLSSRFLQLSLVSCEREISVWCTYIFETGHWAMAIRKPRSKNRIVHACTMSDYWFIVLDNWCTFGRAIIDSRKSKALCVANDMHLIYWTKFKIASIDITFSFFGAYVQIAIICQKISFWN